PERNCHSPLTAAWSTQLLTGSAPQHDSPPGQSADEVHGVVVVEHPVGAAGVAGWNALLMTTDSAVTRTCVSGVGSRSHPATIVPAKPVGNCPWTVRVRRTMTCTLGGDALSCRLTRVRAATPPGAGCERTRHLSLPRGGRGGSGQSNSKSWALSVATGSDSGKHCT